jgi:hypothetical protein
VRRLIITGLAAAAAATFALGCGSGGGEDTTVVQLNKAQFVKQAEPICAKLNNERTKAFAAAVKAGNEKTVLAKVIGPSFEREAEELEELGPPDAAKPMIGKIVKASEVLAEEGVKGAEDPAITAYKEEAYDMGLRTC